MYSAINLKNAMGDGTTYFNRNEKFKNLKNISLAQSENRLTECLQK